MIVSCPIITVVNYSLVYLVLYIKGYLCNDQDGPTDKDNALLRNFLIKPSNYTLEIDYSNKKIDQLPDAISEIDVLRILWLNINNFVELPYSEKLNLSSLEVLHMEYNKITKLQGKYNGCFQNLKHLFLSNNQISLIDNGFLIQFPSLVLLDLKHNRILKLDSGFGKELKNLQILNLSGNQLCHLPSNFLKSVSGLKKLFLNRNLLQCLPDGFGSSFSKLLILDLSVNNLMKLPETFGINMKNLSELSLYSNKLENIPSGVVKGCKNLKTLLLQNNQIKDIEQLFHQSNSCLEKLNLSNNYIMRVPEDTGFNFERLEEFQIRSNNLKSLPYTFGLSMVNLKYLDLGDNKITSLKGNFNFLLPHLVHLNLDQNQIADLPENFGSNMRSLQYLDLSHNNIKTLPIGIIHNLKNIKEIDLRGNKNLRSRGVYKKSLGRQELINIFGSRLKIDEINFTSNHLKHQLVSRPLIWNFCELKNYNTQEFTILDCEPTSRYFNRIIRKLENFVVEESNNLSKRRKINLFASIELEQEDLNRTNSLDTVDYAYELRNYILYLFSPCAYDKIGNKNSKSILKFLFHIFSYIDQIKDIDLIKTYLSIILSCADKCDLRQYEELERLYIQITEQVYYKDCIESYIKYQVSVLKTRVFKSSLAIPNLDENIHIVDYWRLRLKDYLGLPERNFFPSFFGIVGEDPYENNGSLVFSIFLSAFTPEYVIEYLVNLINDEKDRRIFNDLLKKVSLLCISDKEKADLGIMEEEQIYPKIATFELIEFYLIKKFLILKVECN